jgi:hypothetical protein
MCASGQGVIRSVISRPVPFREMSTETPVPSGAAAAAAAAPADGSVQPVSQWNKQGWHWEERNGTSSLVQGSCLETPRMPVAPMPPTTQSECA